MEKNRIEKRSVRVCGLQVRAEGEDPHIISGYAMRFNEKSVYLTSYGDKFIETMSRECYSQAKADAADIKMTLFHNREKLLARSNAGKGSMKLTVDDQGLRFEFASPDTELGKFAEEAIKRGDIAGCSITFYTRDYDFAEQKNSDGGYDEIIIQKDIEIVELTLESDPAYPTTSVEMRSKISEDVHLRKSSAQAAADARRLTEILKNC